MNRNNARERTPSPTTPPRRRSLSPRSPKTARPPSAARTRPLSRRGELGLIRIHNPKNSENVNVLIGRLKHRTKLPYGVALENIERIRFALKHFKKNEINKNNIQQIINKTQLGKFTNWTLYNPHNLVEISGILKKKHISKLTRLGNEFRKKLNNNARY